VLSFPSALNIAAWTETHHPPELTVSPNAYQRRNAGPGGMDEAPEGRLQLGQPALSPTEPDQHDHVVDGHHQIVRPPSQGERLPGQAFRLIKAALEHCLARPEQRGVPGEVELAQLPGRPVERRPKVVTVAQLRLPGVERGSGRKGDRPWASALGGGPAAGSEPQPARRLPG
jgi:hypothetical protein